MSESNLLTNQELQEALSKNLRDLSRTNVELSRVKAFFTGATALIKSVRIDLDANQRLGMPVQERTKRFLAE